MHLLKTFARAYPLQSAVMLFALLIAGLIEGVSLTALLPLLNHVMVKPGTSVGDTQRYPASLVREGQQLPGAACGRRQVRGSHDRGLA